MSDTINPITIHKGPYRGKGQDGQPDNRILYVTAACPKDDVVTYAEFLDSCTLGGILRMGVDRSSEDFYKRVTFAEFRELVAHELEWQRLTWRKLQLYHEHVISEDGTSKPPKVIKLEYDPNNPPPPVTCAFQDPSSGKPGLTDVVIYQGDKELHRCKDLNEAEILEAFGMVRNTDD